MRRVAWLAWLASNVVVAFAPLLSSFGYFAAAALTLGGVGTAMLMGLSAPRAAFGHLGRDLALAGSFPLMGLGLTALRTGLCSPGDSLVMLLVLPMPSFVLAWAIGAWVKSRALPFPGPILGAVLLVSVAISAARAYFTPPIYIFNHLLGYWPGSLYDEAITVDLRLLVFRSLTLVAGAALLAMASTSRWTKRGHLKGLAVFTVLFLAADAGLGALMRFRTTDAELMAALPQTLRYKGIRIHLPASVEPTLADAIRREHAFYYDALREDFGLNAEPAIDSYIFESPSHKARYVGASYTSFVKPWRGQLVIDSPSAEHPVLPHEMVHALLGHAHPSLLGIPIRWGLPDLVMVEGIAVAASPFRGQSPHAFARALLENGTMPPIDAVLDPRGFWLGASRQAYQVAGSFIGWLLETRGPEPLLEAYRGKSFQASYATTLPELELGWHAWLRAGETSADEAEGVEDLLKERSLLEKPCPSLVAKTKAALRGLPQHQRRPLYDKLCALYNDRHDLQLQRALGSFNDDELIEAQHRLRSLALTDSERMTLLVRLTPLVPDEERSPLADEVAELARSEGERRQAFALRYLAKPSFREEIARRLVSDANAAAEYQRLLLRYLAGSAPDGPSLALLGALSDEPLVGYLLARRLLGGPLHERGLDLLRESPLTSPSIQREIHRLRCQGVYQAPPETFVRQITPLLASCEAWVGHAISPLDADKAKWATRRAKAYAATKGPDPGP